MVQIRFEHVLTFTSAPSLEDHLARYAQAGFLVAERTVAHNLGIRTGFVLFGAEYLEFCWVEDEQVFASTAPSELTSIRETPRPFNIGLVAEDLDTLRDAWITQGYRDLPPIEARAPRDTGSDAAPRWRILNMPNTFLPGSQCFALTYLPKPREQRVQTAPNTIYAIGGISFVVHRPQERAQRWRDALAPQTPLQIAADGCCQVLIGPHLATWMTPQSYQEHFGLVWRPAPHPFGEIAVIHLLAENLNCAAEMVKQVRRDTTRRLDGHNGQDTLILPPQPCDGYMFAITARPLKEWAAERAARTGEMFEIVHPTR